LTWDDPNYDIRFEDVIYNGTDAGAMRFLVVGREYGNDSVYHPLAATNVDIQWQDEIVTGPSLVTNLHLGYQAAATVDAIYCMGYTDVNRTSSSGQYWDGGLLASISTQGQVNWVRTYDASNWSDRFYDCQL
jgi:hypothetical protein